jgi:hypothetical protein
MLIDELHGFLTAGVNLVAFPLDTKSTSLCDTPNTARQCVCHTQSFLAKAGSVRRQSAPTN